MVQKNNIVEFYGNKYFQVPMGKAWGLRGATDFIDWYINDEGETILRVIDWKTGPGEADDLQLSVYALMVWKLYNLIEWDKIETRFFYLEQGGKSPSTYWTRETLVSAYKYVEAKAMEFITAGTFSRKMNKYCSYCEFFKECPEAQRALQVQDSGVRKYSIEEIDKLIEKLEQVEAAKKIISKIETELKQQRNDLLLPFGRDGYTVGGYKFTCTERTSRYEYDTAAIFTEAQELIGRPPFECLKFDGTAYNKLIREQTDKAIKKALKKALENNRQVSSTSVTFKKQIAAKEIPINDASEDEL